VTIVSGEFSSNVPPEYSPESSPQIDVDEDDPISLSPDFSRRTNVTSFYDPTRLFGNLINGSLPNFWRFLLTASVVFPHNRVKLVERHTRPGRQLTRKSCFAYTGVARDENSVLYRHGVILFNANCGRMAISW